MRRTIVVVVGTVVLAATLSASAYADWTEGQSSKEYGDCVGSCQTNPNIQGEQGKCPSYCGCLVTGWRRQFPDYGELYRLINVDPKTKAAVQATINTCNRDTFGGEARKVDFDKVQKPR